MRSYLRRKLAELADCTSGNALMLVALGMPVLIGGGGLAVDTAQWYMWKGELQYAADQAAIAGAWARTKDATSASYDARAEQEFATNLEIVGDFSAEPQVSLEDWATGNDNSVVVTASATKKLPFSFFVAGVTATVTVKAQAAFERGLNAPACLVAVDEHADGAITIGGSAQFIAGCGIKALSDAGRGSEDKDCTSLEYMYTSDCTKKAIRVNGNPVIRAGSLVAEGAIDSWFDDTTNPNNRENSPVPFADSLTDNFADLEPPSTAESQVSRTYSCTPGTKTTRANKKTDVETTYTYYKGYSPDANGDGALTSAELAAATWTVQTNSRGKSKETSSTSQNYVIVENDTVDGVTTTTTRTVTKTNNSTGDNATWELKTTVTTQTQSGTTSTTTVAHANLLPGTYTDLKLSCNTVFSPGIYVVNGGDLEIHSQYDVTGAGVMFVLKNGAGLIINGGSNVNLTAMTVSELQTAGVAYDEAVKLAGMLIFEDRDSEGSTGNKLNGNASTILNGTIYLPVSNLDIKGSAGVTTQCLLLVASTISISGNVDMESFCPGDEEQHAQDTQLPSRVRLVS
jgi:Flp pilus assembly protein TadG